MQESEEEEAKRQSRTTINNDDWDPESKAFELCDGEDDVEVVEGNFNIGSSVGIFCTALTLKGNWTLKSSLSYLKEHLK